MFHWPCELFGWSMRVHEIDMGVPKLLRNFINQFKPWKPIIQTTDKVYPLSPIPLIGMVLIHHSLKYEPQQKVLIGYSSCIHEV